MLVTYLGFVVAFLILSWAVFEISRRYLSQRRGETKRSNTWVKMDPTFENEVEKPLMDEDADEHKEDVPGANIHIRAQHNGHHSESKKLL